MMRDEEHPKTATQRVMELEAEKMKWEETFNENTRLTKELAELTFKLMGSAMGRKFDSDELTLYKAEVEQLGLDRDEIWNSNVRQKAKVEQLEAEIGAWDSTLGGMTQDWEAAEAKAIQLEELLCQRTMERDAEHTIVLHLEPRCAAAEAEVERLKGELVLVRAEAAGLGSMLLDVQKDCITYKQLLETVLAPLRGIENAMKRYAKDSSLPQAVKWSLEAALAILDAEKVDIPLDKPDMARETSPASQELDKGVDIPLEKILDGSVFTSNGCFGSFQWYASRCQLCESIEPCRATYDETGEKPLEDRLRAVLEKWEESSKHVPLCVDCMLIDIMAAVREE